MGYRGCGEMEAGDAWLFSKAALGPDSPFEEKFEFSTGPILALSLRE